MISEPYPLVRISIVLPRCFEPTLAIWSEGPAKGPYHKNTPSVVRLEPAIIDSKSNYVDLLGRKERMSARLLILMEESNVLLHTNTSSLMVHRCALFTALMRASLNSINLSYTNRKSVSVWHLVMIDSSIVSLSAFQNSLVMKSSTENYWARPPDNWLLLCIIVILVLARGGILDWLRPCSKVKVKGRMHCQSFITTIP